MTVLEHEEINKDCKILGKRYPQPRESLDAWIKLFLVKGLSGMTGCEGYPGFGECHIYKARVVPLQENIGKSKGYRIIFQMINNEIFKVLVFTRHTMYNTEGELVNLIKERLQN